MAVVPITVYVKANSKAEINRKLAAGHRLVGVQYRMGDVVTWPLGDLLPDESVVKVFNREVDGSPYAKAYGKWDQKKGRVK